MVSPFPSPPALSSDEMNSCFKWILDNLIDGVYLTDLQRRITYWNKAAEDLTGYRAEEVIGKRCADNILMPVNDSGRLLYSGERLLNRTITAAGSRRASSRSLLQTATPAAA